MRIIEDTGEMQAWARLARAGGERIAFVPTMGCLHDGHRALLKRGRQEAGKGGRLVLSIFVNPAQFGPKEDFKTYPKDLERDLGAAREEGADIVFTPEAAGMYPDGFETYVEVTGLQGRLCGLSRPGHFRGVATVVLKLFNIVMPHAAVFGRKDYQQLLIIRKMVRDLNLGIEVIGLDTVREPDGLAMSSRNKYLSPEERRAALSIPRALDAAKEAFSRGVRDGSAITDGMKKIIEKESAAVIEYIRVCDKRSLEDLETIKDGALAAVAVRVGRARLIDNCVLGEE